MIIKVSPSRDYFSVLARTFGNVTAKKREVTELHIHPVDLYLLRTNPAFTQQFDTETQRKLVMSGIAGYLWGVVVKFTWDLPEGSFRLRTRALGSK